MILTNKELVEALEDAFQASRRICYAKVVEPKFRELSGTAVVQIARALETLKIQAAKEEESGVAL